MTRHSSLSSTDYLGFTLRQNKILSGFLLNNTPHHLWDAKMDLCRWAYTHTVKLYYFYYPLYYYYYWQLPFFFICLIYTQIFGWMISQKYWSKVKHSRSSNNKLKSIICLSWINIGSQYRFWVKCKLQQIKEMKTPDFTEIIHKFLTN